MTLQPIIFIAAVHVRLRRRDRRRLAARLPAVPAPRHPRPDDRLRRRRDRRQPQLRHREGRLRPLPSRCRSPAPRRSSAPCSATSCATSCCASSRSASATCSASAPRPTSPEVLAALRAGDRLRAVPVLDLGLHRHDRPHPRLRPGHPVPALFPLTFGASTFVPVDTLPDWLQTFTEVNPLTHLVGACAGCCSAARSRPQTSSGRSAGWARLLAVFVPLALRAYSRRA